jgi:hypothetical protein
MFCDACGTAMSAGQTFCGACGKRVGIPVAPPAGVGDGRVAQHLEILAWLWIAIAALTLLVALIFLIVGVFPYARFIPADSLPPGVMNMFHLIFLGVGGVCLLIAAAHFIAAWGLFQHAEWARILTIVFAFLRILEFPLGTALGVYTIWVLMGPNSEKEYRAFRPA